MDINQLAKDIHQNAVAHGWWDAERSYAEIIALIHSELSEALEESRSGKPFIYFVIETFQEDGKLIPEVRTDYDDGNYDGEKPEGIVVELADVIIRILDYCGERGLDIGEALEIRRAAFDTYTLPELVAECHYLLSMAYRDIESCCLYFAECLSIIDYWAQANGCNISEAIAIKHKYNKTRPYRHGKKF
jgi:NTP pyrophosphatase (non-canonical NTP hydrolase)